MSHASNAEGELTFASVSKARGGVTSVFSNIPHDLETLAMTPAMPTNLFILPLYIVMPPLTSRPTLLVTAKPAIVRLLHHALRLVT